MGCIFGGRTGLIIIYYDRNEGFYFLDINSKIILLCLGRRSKQRKKLSFTLECIKIYLLRGLKIDC